MRIGRIAAALSALFVLAAPHQALAQNAPRVGWIFPGASAGNPTEVAGFKEGLRELGYVEGRNIVVEYRFGARSFLESFRDTGRFRIWYSYNNDPPALSTCSSSTATTSDSG
jgi:hypothetical protein